MHAEDASDVLGSRWSSIQSLNLDFHSTIHRSRLGTLERKNFFFSESCLENRSPSEECSAYIRSNDWKLMVRSSFHYLVSRRRYFIHEGFACFLPVRWREGLRIMISHVFSFSSSLSTSFLRSFLPQTHTFCPEHSPLPSVTRFPGMKIKFKNGSVVKQSPKAKKIKRSQGIWLSFLFTSSRP